MMTDSPEDFRSQAMHLQEPADILRGYNENQSILLQGRPTGYLSDQRNAPIATSNLSDQRNAPIATIGSWTPIGLTASSPLSGLQYLQATDKVYIQQTVELLDLLSTIESENRFLIKNENKETIYVAAEKSSASERQLWGSSRPFEMHLVDPHGREAIHFSRQLGCCMCCCFCCLEMRSHLVDSPRESFIMHRQESFTTYCRCFFVDNKVKSAIMLWACIALNAEWRPKSIDIFSPPGRKIGSVQQQWTLFIPTFFIKNANNDTIFTVEGPSACLCSSYREAEFKVLSRDGLMQVATISHQWDEMTVAGTSTGTYVACVTFPPEIDETLKGVLLGAAFLIEYAFFEVSKRGTL